MPERVIVAGVATRALARSAARAGYRVTAVDAFGDVDLRAVADVIAPRREGGRFSAMSAARAAQDVAASMAAYTSNFENYPDAVACLAIGRSLLGNAPRVLEQIRNPITLMRALARRGFAVPRTRASAPVPSRGSWLLKTRRSGGGHGTSPWLSGTVPRSAYLQSRIAGLPGSITFVADVGEEGLGDLRGMKELFGETLKGRIDRFVSVDGAGLGLTRVGVGSFRYRLTYKGPGGHSYGAFGIPNPIHALGRAIARISDVEVPMSPKTTFNVGVIDGGKKD